MRGTDDVRKRYAIRLAYREDGHTPDIYYSSRVTGDALMVLVVDGPGGPATRELFDAVDPAAALRATLPSEFSPYRPPNRAAQRLC